MSHIRIQLFTYMKLNTIRYNKGKLLRVINNHKTIEENYPC